MLIEHARRELQAAGYKLDGPGNGPNKWMTESLLELLEVFSKQGHSGASAGYCIATFSKLAAFEPLAPLKGTPDEWVDVGDGLYQNNRCSHVFMEQGKAYDAEGIIWRDPDGCCVTNRDSRVPVTFPYVPKREYRDRPAT